LRIVAREDETVEVGGELAVIDDGSGGEADSGATAAAPSTPSEPSAPSAPSESQPAQPEPQAAASSAPSGVAAGTPVTLPELGESVTEGTVTRWLKQVGDTVEVGEPLLASSTDQVDTEELGRASGR